MRHTLLFIVLFFIYGPLAAQIVPKPDSEDSAKLADAIQYLQVQENIPKAPRTVQSPNVASFGSHGEIPVSLYTGKPEISVNLHEVSDGAVEIPISLIYDAAGLRPEQHPGWVGMNFTLSTHYAVTRTVRDAPDDNKPSASTLGEHGYAYHTALLNGVDWFQNDLTKKVRHYSAPTITRSAWKSIGIIPRSSPKCGMDTTGIFIMRRSCRSGSGIWTMEQGCICLRLGAGA